MRRSPRLRSSATRHKHNPDLYRDGNNSSKSASSQDSGSSRGKRRPQVGWMRPPKPCSPPLDGAGGLWLSTAAAEAAGTGAAAGAAPEVRSLPYSPTELSRESADQPPSKSLMSRVLQRLRLLPPVFGEVLGVFCRVLLAFSVFTTRVWGAFPYFTPVGDEAVKVFLTLSESHDKIQAQGLLLQKLQSEVHKLQEDLACIRAAKSERVAQIVFQRLNEDFVQKPDYALSSVGASIDLDKTSDNYEDKGAVSLWKWFSFWSSANPPSIILQPDVFPGNCWAFQGSKGQVVIRLPGPVHLSDITFQHPPLSVAHNGDASSAPRDFAVYGLQDDDKTEILLGKFTFDVHESVIQTFHLKNEPPEAFPKVKIEIVSNWGQSRFTCLYRVRVHGSHSHHIQGEDSRAKGERKGEPH